MLQQLIAYAKREGFDSEPGFITHEIKWEAQIGPDGKLINVIPLGDEDGGEDTPKCPLMHNMQAGGRAHFLVETAQTVALLFKKNEEEKKIKDTNIRHQFFSKLIQEAAENVSLLKPLAVFLTNPDQVMALNGKLKGNAKPGERLKWSIAGIDVVTNSVVRDWWRTWRKKDLAKGKDNPKPKRTKSKTTSKKDESVSDDMVCFLSGNIVTPLLAHNKIMKLVSVGGQPGGDVVVGCDKNAFSSFGLKKSCNAAMGDFAASGYVDALNHLIKNHSRKLANALVVHWFKEAVKQEDDPLAFLFEPPQLTEAAAQSTARQILDSLRIGKRSSPTNNRYFAMTMSGASGRVMVRDWMEGSFEELVLRISQWFSDMEIVARDGGNLAHDPKFMAVCGSLMRDLKDLPAPTATTLWRVALTGLPIPQTLIAQALARFCADLIDDKPFNHARMGLIKAYFIRKGGNHSMSAYLNKEHPEPAYHCGRLLAMLASLQYAALGDVGAGVVQRYYVAASQTPGLTLGRLIGYAKNHLNKLEGGLAFWYEDQIAEIWSQIRDYIPRTLNLEQQTLFALGYYQQIAANRAGKKINTNEPIKGEKV